MEEGPKLNLSPDAIKRLRDNTGKLSCTGAGSISGTATLVGNGTSIVTAAHAFVGANGKDTFAKFNCSFTTFASPPISRKVMVDTHNPNAMGIGKHFPVGTGNDYAIVKLDRPITGTKPFPIDLSSTQLPDGHKTYVVSAFQTGLPNLDKTQPIIESCDLKGAGFGIRTTTYSNTCHVDPGASGGGQYLINGSGDLVFKGMIVEGGKKMENPLDPENGNSRISLGLESEFLKDIMRIDPSITVGHGAVADLKG